MPTSKQSSQSVAASRSGDEHQELALDLNAGPDRLLGTEWLLTNGLGGFAMGTAMGVNARRYHALLVAATAPPVGRVVVLNQVLATLRVGGGVAGEGEYELSSCHFPVDGGRARMLHPSGYLRFRSFATGGRGVCQWEHVAGDGVEDFRVRTELQVLDGSNGCALTYTIERVAGAAKRKGAARSARLTLRPMMSLRDFHALLRRDGAELRVAVGARAGGALVGVSRGGLDAQLIATNAAFTHDEQWWDSFLYPMDADRGQDATEDLFSPGVFTVELGAGETIARACVQVSLVSHGGPGSLVDLAADRTARDRRIAGMIKVCVGSGSHDTAIARLSAAADQFVVRREARAGVPGGSSIIAGYPWFADWGRDTSIALPGLLISTGRLEEAGQVLDGFAGYRRRGIVPNVFDDATGEPEYNTVDASLWFVLAACTYLERSGDRARFDAKLAPACADVIACYRRGTDFAIAMDPIDKLITAGDASTQLTWMDARRDGVVFTPRFGKAVEINALWHAALRAFARAMRGADDALSESLSELAASVGKSLRTSFWDPVNGCMHDCLAPAEVDGRPVWSASKQVRPNQIFAVSLPDSPLSIDQQRGVLACVEAKLLTPMGLRTLDPADPAYRARYEGSLFTRDAAYHNGTAWPWLLGAYAEAVLRVGAFSDESKRKARAALAPIIESMGGSRHAEARGHGGCLGQIAEIFDASDPQRPQGCPAQAWSVAEVLRVLTMMG